MFYCLQIATTAVSVAAQSSHLRTHSQHVCVFVCIRMRLCERVRVFV